MILEVVQLKWSLTWYDPLGPRMCVLELMNGHVLQTLREQLKVPGSRLEGSELLTSEFLRFRSRLNVKVFKCQKPFIVRNNSIERGDVHGKEEFVVAWETKLF